MTSTDPTGARTSMPPPDYPRTTEVRGTTSDSFDEGRDVYTPKISETKPSFGTTEFWAMLIGIAALVFIYNVADDPSLNLWRTCLLGTIGASAYFISRGLAKSGSRNERWRRETR